MTEPAIRLNDHGPQLNRGYVHVYTGDGKGKTTAALGLAIRAVGSGLRVAVALFMKNRDSGEFRILERLGAGIRVHDYGSGCFIQGPPDIAETLRAQTGYRSLKRMMAEGGSDLMILDEANMAVACGLLPAASLMDLIHSKPAELELVITGRYAHPEVIAAADLVTEMKEVKHYYHTGVRARPGIDM